VPAPTASSGVVARRSTSTNLQQLQKLKRLVWAFKLIVHGDEKMSPSLGSDRYETVPAAILESGRTSEFADSAGHPGPHATCPANFRLPIYAFAASGCQMLIL
jgi:hypothetical protein